MFLPLTAVGSILGMNLVSGLEDTNPPGTFWMLTIAAFFTGIGLLLLLAFKKK